MVPNHAVPPTLYIKANYDDVIKMETFSALLAICAGNSPVPGEFPTQRPVTRSFDLRLKKRLRRYRAHCDVIVMCKHNGIVHDIGTCMVRYIDI